MLAPVLPNGAAAALHLSISDSTGDSAIFEYIDGKLVIHHGKQYAVMTNSPIYEKQIALEEYWKSIGGLVFCPAPIGRQIGLREPRSCLALFRRSWTRTSSPAFRSNHLHTRPLQVL